jgi:hypothetical protein
VDDTGARHKANNGFCTHIGNDSFAWFGTTDSKSRLNFLDLLRAGYTVYLVNEDAWRTCARERLPGRALPFLRSTPDKRFADTAAWQAHLERLGIAALTVRSDL